MSWARVGKHEKAIPPPVVRVTNNNFGGRPYRRGALNVAATRLCGHPRVSMMQSTDGRYGLKFGPDEDYRISKRKRGCSFVVYGIPEGVYDFEIEGDLWILSPR